MKIEDAKEGAAIRITGREGAMSQISVQPGACEIGQTGAVVHSSRENGFELIAAKIDNAGQLVWWFDACDLEPVQP